MNQLTIRVVPDGDRVWQIHFDLHTETFSGRGWFWGAPESLTEFASELSTYPLANEPALVLGYDQMQGDDIMLHLRIRPNGPLGALEARAEITDRDDPTCRLKAKLLTSYASLDRFVPQLRALASGTRSEAVLLGG
ncbi:hypothetical protein QE419_001533 [Brevundimonas vesicularis]|uniref:hypothetical protein n=1 Tax=Brevundimonas vesicularis TaxID=41276 RepID=UPI0027811BA0|nr:hypothetical protein [Brevundimonas vesicularis]MDQ1192767.1 hypothetical protein [Brevundimonas vesicularis]